MRIIENPFPDIVPRITAAERKAQFAAKLKAKQELEKQERRQKHGKNTKLLSFGEEEEVGAFVGVKKKQLGRADCQSICGGGDDVLTRSDRGGWTGGFGQVIRGYAKVAARRKQGKC